MRVTTHGELDPFSSSIPQRTASLARVAGERESSRMAARSRWPPPAAQVHLRPASMASDHA